jgi:hypothetical protein
VSGQAGARGLRVQDVVLAIDLSDSTVEPCGIDLDGDGEGADERKARLAGAPARRARDAARSPSAGT